MHPLSKDLLEQVQFFRSLRSWQERIRENDMELAKVPYLLAWEL